MRFLVAPDSFKGTLAAEEAAAAMALGVQDGWPGSGVRQLPLADGGEGTAAVLVRLTGGRWRSCRVADPLGRPIEARWAILGDGQTAVVELAAASGLQRLRPADLRPLEASTCGTGQLIRAALDAGCRRLLVALGGSATTDGGTGLLSALGARFLDAEGRPLPPGGGALARLARIDLDPLDPRLRHVPIVGACDVDNPLTGPQGAARVYGPQKGATPAMVEQLETGLSRLAQVAAATLGRDLQRHPRTGAAGGTGFGLLAFLGAQLEAGAELVMDMAGFDRHLQEARVVITGEGHTDRQTLHGKLVMRVARRARQRGKPVVVVSGGFDPDVVPDLEQAGVTAVLAASPGGAEPDAAWHRLRQGTAGAVRLIRLGTGMGARSGGHPAP